MIEGLKRRIVMIISSMLLCSCYNPEIPSRPLYSLLVQNVLTIEIDSQTTRLDVYIYAESVANPYELLNKEYLYVLDRNNNKIYLQAISEGHYAATFDYSWEGETTLIYVRDDRYEDPEDASIVYDLLSLPNVHIGDHKDTYALGESIKIRLVSDSYSNSGNEMYPNILISDLECFGVDNDRGFGKHDIHIDEGIFVLDGEFYSISVEQIAAEYHEKTEHEEMAFTNCQGNIGMNMDFKDHGDGMIKHRDYGAPSIKVDERFFREDNKFVFLQEYPNTIRLKTDQIPVRFSMN